MGEWRRHRRTIVTIMKCSLSEEELTMAKGLGGARVIGAAQFKARCLELLKDVHRRRAALVVTKHGKPIVRVVAYDEDVPETFGALRGTVTYQGDIVGPDRDSWGDHA